MKLTFTDQECFNRMIKDVLKTRKHKNCYKPVDIPVQCYILTSEGSIHVAYVRYGRSYTAKRCVMNWVGKKGSKSFVREKDLQFLKKCSVISVHNTFETKCFTVRV